MIRNIFQHIYSEQKEFENLHVQAIRTMSKVTDLQSQPAWHSNNGLPSKAVGKNGDFYIDKNNGNIYEKDNGLWI